MGLIKAITGAAGGVLADQWKEDFYCVSLSSKKRRGGIGWNIGIGIALSFSYILFMKFSEMFVYTDTLPPGWALWLPNILFAVIAAVLYHIAPK